MDWEKLEGMRGIEGVEGRGEMRRNAVEWDRKRGRKKGRRGQGGRGKGREIGGGRRKEGERGTGRKEREKREGEEKKGTYLNSIKGDQDRS